MISRSSFVALAFTALALVACKKKESAPSAGTGTGSTSPQPKPDPRPDPKPQPPADADYLKVVANHVDPNKGPVELSFGLPTVTKASFDPANLEGGTAELEVDVTSLSTGIAKRDNHLKSPDYLDVATFPKATIKVANVKKTGDGAYSADATVSIHGVEKTWPLAFTVLSSTADSVRVKFTQPFSRLDFGVGKPETDDSSKAQVELQGVLTIKKS